MANYTINIHGRLMSLTPAAVMGIMNITPDSFYSGSRTITEEAISDRARKIINEGAKIIDVGACSTRPKAVPVSQEEEINRLRLALPIIRRISSDIAISVDTFRPQVAQIAIEELGADIINDVGVTADEAAQGIEAKREEMFRMVARLRVPYILMSTGKDINSVLMQLSKEVQQLRDLGQNDIILDPGFGFGKNVNEDLALLSELDKMQVMDLPILVALSRKRMAWQNIGCKPADPQALEETIRLNDIALKKGANIIRVHDIKEAVQQINEI
jgi:dihydropteroate synthase